MASLAESSIASVPYSHLLQLQEKLLQQQPGANAQQPEVSINTFSHDASKATSTTKYTSGKDERSTIPESANAYRTPNSSPKGPPRLASSKSAPATEMEAMVQPSPSQEAFVAMTRASSFHGYPGGDTQPMESQVYRDYNESVAKSATTTPKKTVVRMEISPDGKIMTYNTATGTAMTGRTPKTCEEGDTGYIDLENAWAPPSPTARSISSNMDGLLDSPGTQLRAEIDGSNAAMPTTPSLVGQKRKHSGEIQTSEPTVKSAPAISQLFGGGRRGNMLSATQLFDQTQAPSSPVPEGPRSDPVMTRPSPNLHNQFSLSSPTMIMSSPVATMHTKPPATMGEPREHYTSMQESQERRVAKFRQEIGLPSTLPEGILEVDEEAEDEDPEQRRFMHKRMQRVMSDQALHQWSKVRAPSRHSGRPTSSPKQLESVNRPAMIDLVTPATARKGEPSNFDVSDDGHKTDEDILMEEDKPEDGERSNDEYDEYDEYGQTVLRSQANDEDDNEVPTIYDDAFENDDDDADEAPLQLVSQGKNDVQRVTQQSAVADSQPELAQKSRSLLQEQPTVSSFVAGSQYAGASSAAHTTAHIKGSMPNHTQPQASDYGQDTRVPSSPPIDVSASSLPENSTEISVVRQQMLTRFQRQQSTATEQEIPESDLPDLDADRTGSSRPVTANSRTQSESNNVPPFSTARSHLSASGPTPKKAMPAPSPLKVVPSQQSKVASQSPRTAAGVRHFADIAGAPAPPAGSGESEMDVDAILSDVITAEDEEYMKAVSSPSPVRPQKRRRLNRFASCELMSPARSGSSDNVKSVAPAGLVTDVVEDIPEPQVDESEILEDPTTALRESPSKGNELPKMTGKASEQLLSPQSVKDREQAGAKAVSQLASRRSSTKKPTRANSKQKNEAKPQMSLREQAKAQVAVKAPKKSRVPVIRPTNHGADEGRVEGEDLSGEQDVGVSEAEGVGDRSITSNVASKRIFALFKGQYNAYYPATWLGSDETGYRVRFDDTTVTSIEAHHVRALDLRLGDQVKVDVAGMRNKTWLVQGSGPVAKGDEERALGTDTSGRLTVKVQVKPSKSSLPSGTAATEGEGQIHDVAVAAIYLTHTMWPHIKDREFQPPSISTSVSSAAPTPTNGLQTPTASTPTSRPRRSIVPTAKAMDERTSVLREDLAAPSSSPGGSGLFTGMAFAISYGSNDGEKAEVTRMIQRNGGLILESGFDELFTLPKLEESITTSPTKKSTRKDDDDIDNDDDHALQLKSQYAELTFVALIADKHSRRAKYIQALALGLPTLSGRWVVDSLEASRSSDAASESASTLPWSRYLLAAGESTFLSGAVRSRTLLAYAAESARLSDTIADRSNLLGGDGVLIVVPKKSKSVWERRKAYAFLTLALGAGSVKRVSDLQEAKAWTQEPQNWKWIYVEGSVAEASPIVFGKSAAGGKKRKRGDEDVKVRASAMSTTDGNVKIVNDEFVVQSLILGALVD